MAKNNQKRKEAKQQYRLWIKPSIMERVEILKETDNCASLSEFTEKALLFYLGYLSDKDSQSYLPNVITSTIKGIMTESTNKQNTLLFKIAVELALVENILASMNNNLSKELLQSLRGYCVAEVKKTHGILTFDDVLRSQGIE